MIPPPSCKNNLVSEPPSVLFPQLFGPPFSGLDGTTLPPEIRRERLIALLLLHGVPNTQVEHYARAMHFATTFEEFAAGPCGCGAMAGAVVGVHQTGPRSADDPVAKGA